mmetsp:Transcript_93099/g.277950  ORF Transcript_93099/g.277950 Transcript_93099/m.277950 type:complete len:229 (+) Transcript_93099:1268-1954(+)
MHLLAGDDGGLVHQLLVADAAQGEAVHENRNLPGIHLVHEVAPLDLRHHGVYELEVDKVHLAERVERVEDLYGAQLGGVRDELAGELLQVLLVPVLHPHQAVADEVHLRHGEGLILAPLDLHDHLLREGVLHLEVQHGLVRLDVLLQLVVLPRGEDDGREAPVVQVLQPILGVPQYLVHHEVGLLQVAGAVREAERRHDEEPAVQVLHAVDQAPAEGGEDVRVPVLEL